VNYFKKRFRHSSTTWQVVIVDNGSTDNTTEVAQGLKNTYGAMVTYQHISTKGRGNAIATALLEYPASLYLYLDVDIPLILEDLDRYLSPLEQGKADIVVGKRYGTRPFIRRVMTAGLRVVQRVLLGMHFSDPQSGIKAFRARAVPTYLSCSELGYYRETEFLVRGQRASLVVREVPIRWIERRYQERSSKIRVIRDSWEALRAMTRIAKRIRRERGITHGYISY
jgi:glycosyltransferase involved in cell wall biosynthesis